MLLSLIATVLFEFSLPHFVLPEISLFLDVDNITRRVKLSAKVQVLRPMKAAQTILSCLKIHCLDNDDTKHC